MVYVSDSHTLRIIGDIGLGVPNAQLLLSDRAGTMENSVSPSLCSSSPSQHHLLIYCAMHALCYRIVATVIAPTPLIAADFMILGQIIYKLGEQYSRISSRLYSRIFLTIVSCRDPAFDDCRLTDLRVGYHLPYCTSAWWWTGC